MRFNTFILVAALVLGVLTSFSVHYVTAEADATEVAAATPKVTWELEHVQHERNAPLPLDGRRPYTLSFDADGQFVGQADCHRYGGGFLATHTGVFRLRGDFYRPGSCPPNPTVDTFLTLLQRTKRFTIIGDQLFLRSDRGTLGFRKRVPGASPAEGLLQPGLKGVLNS